MRRPRGLACAALIGSLTVLSTACSGQTPQTTDEPMPTIGGTGSAEPAPTVTDGPSPSPSASPLGDDPANPDPLPEDTPPGTALSLGESMVVKSAVGVLDMDEGWSVLEYTVTEVVDGDDGLIDDLDDPGFYEDGSVVEVRGTVKVLAKSGAGIDGMLGGKIGVWQSNGESAGSLFSLEDTGCDDNFIVSGLAVGESADACTIALIKPDNEPVNVIYYGDGTVQGGEDSDNPYWQDPVTWDL